MNYYVVSVSKLVCLKDSREKLEGDHGQWTDEGNFIIEAERYFIGNDGNLSFYGSDEQKEGEELGEISSEHWYSIQKIA